MHFSTWKRLAGAMKGLNTAHTGRKAWVALLLQPLQRCSAGDNPNFRQGINEVIIKRQNNSTEQAALALTCITLWSDLERSSRSSFSARRICSSSTWRQEVLEASDISRCQVWEQTAGHSMNRWWGCGVWRDKDNRLSLACTHTHTQTHIQTILHAYTLHTPT